MNIVLIEGEGCALFAWRGPGVYEAHVNFEQRGRAALTTARQMLGYMRRLHKINMLWTAIPIASRNVIIFARMLGWKSRGVAEFPHGHCEIFAEDNSCHI